MKRINQYLAALDLDGTSVRYEPRLEMDPVLMNYIESVSPQRFAWVMNSDRYTANLIEVAQFLEPETRPIAVLSCQRFIHFLDGQEQYAPLYQWNEQQTVLHQHLWNTILPFFDDWKKVIEEDFTIIDYAINDLVFAFMVPTAETPCLRERMRALIKPWPNAQVSGNQEWTFILHSSFSKGNVLSKCANILGISCQNIIAIGDGINDISMLNGSITPMVGCPANASWEVIEVVTKAGGIVADSEAAEGTVQILKYYLNT